MAILTRTAVALAAITSLAAGCAATATAASPAVCKSLIVYMRESSGPPRILTMSANGAHARMLRIGHAPAWSPNGRLIAFDLLTSNGGHIMVMRADGKGVRDITPGLTGYNVVDPAWSPDGRWIVFGGERAGTRNAALWLVRSDGTHLHKLVKPPGEGEHAHWSPSGRWIVFDAFPVSGPDHLYVVRRDGTGLRKITSDALDAWGPDWVAPNEILFADGSGVPTDNIFSVRPDGTALRQMTHAPNGVTYGMPSQARPGGTITFTRQTSNGSAVYTMTARGTRLRNLTRGQPGFNGWSNWSSCPA